MKSSELRLRKPEPETFEAIADSMNITLDAILFFDDSEENIRGAQAVGMHAIHVKEHSDPLKDKPNTTIH
jgi:HAD superfamily hydrolase (TIGR01509 family)